MIKLHVDGDFHRSKNFIERARQRSKTINLESYGRAGIAALASATPIDSGITANSWHYVIERTSSRTVINFTNSNVQNGVLVAILIQYGHGTKNGGYVIGRDYINPAIRPLFDSMAKDIWLEVTKG